MRTKVKMEKSNCRQKCFVCDVFLTDCNPGNDVQSTSKCAIYIQLSLKQGLGKVSLYTKYTGPLSSLLYHFIYLSLRLAVI